MKVVIVIPTYNEEENVSRLLPALEQEFLQLPNHQCHVLIVDGNSTDRTQEIVLGFANTHPFVHLMVEKEKEGLGAAYKKGYHKAIHELGADVVMEMDGDLQHDPKDIKRFLAEIDGGSDFVIGSRYIAGGGVPKEWAFYRKFLSRGGNVFTRIVLGIKMSEFMNGFRATRVKGILDQIAISELVSNGFAYKLDLLYKVYKAGAKMKEIPVVFGLRDRGDSKMGGNNFMDSLRVVLLIRFSQDASFFKFMVVGASGALVDFGFANLLKLSGVQAGMAATLAVIIAMVFNFTLNNLWAFSQKKIVGVGNLLKKFVPFVLFSTVPVVFRFVVVSFVTASISESYIAYNISIAFCIGLGLLWNYFIYSRVIWNTR